MTHGDKIRSMTDEELVELLFDGAGASTSPPGRNCMSDCRWDSCRDCWLDYLKEEAEDAAEPGDFPPCCVTCSRGQPASPDGFDGIKCLYGGTFVRPWAHRCDKYAGRGSA